uniref:ribosomal protein S11 n=1 Tax=Hypnea wynnei TaxID=1867777 RepID=UPI003001C433|nr:ribosomal protein S11 [Hypnea wynnei]
MIVHKSKKVIILNVIFTLNNILYMITDLKGDVLFWSSVGSHKIKNTKKITTTSIFLSIKDLKFFLNRHNFNYIFLNIKGFSKYKKVVLKYLKQFYSEIILIYENTNISHNGCKNSKIRRL